MTTTNETVLELMKQHVLRSGEEVSHVHQWPDGIGLTTSLRHFVAGPEPADWTLSAEPWVDDVVIAVRDDIIVIGEPLRYGFLVPSDGAAIYLNDADAVAALGGRLGEGMSPLGFAEVLVAFHPYSSATRAVVRTEADLTELFSGPTPPEVAPLQLESSTDGVALTFTSYARYAPTPASAPLLDLTEWTVTVPAGGPAGWTTRLTAEGLPLTT